jgi:glycerol kinase
MDNAKPFWTSRTFWLLLATILTPLAAKLVGPSADKNAIQDAIVQAGETVVPAITGLFAIYTRATTTGAPLTITPPSKD